LVFLFCMLIATALELATSYLLELAIGSWPWQTYADYTYNFQARIALSPSIRFGLGGLLFLYVLQPLFERFTNRLGPTRTRILAIVFLVMFAADIVYSFLLK
ncbi:MAG: putative ABC transporter permease, partial [Lachnospiraceae bacterium]|nr:putative ABC transporter permease [Lachnospiraceae bacterium]